jgi:23S rRNA (adenine-N6)-dimethyltransferase
VRAPHDGRHENGQNFLVDPAVIDALVELVAATSGPIIEIGPGDGALTRRLRRLRRPLTAIEIDARLARRAIPGVTIVHADFLRYRLPSTPHALVGNLPFHQTTAMLRHMLHSGGWTSAVVVVQWEVARRRAAVGGASMMTAQWWPWFDFELARRVPSTAFRPRPSVDGGLLTMRRRECPLVDAAARRAYQGFVHAVFTGRGRGLRDILVRARPHASASAITSWLRREHAGALLPRDLTARQWVSLFALGEAAPCAGQAAAIGRPAGRRRLDADRRGARPGTLEP